MSGGHRLHMMADSEDNIKRQKRLILHESTEEFEASRQGKVSFTLKRFVLRLRASVSSLCIRPGSTFRWTAFPRCVRNTISNMNHTRSRLMSGRFSTNLGVFTAHSRCLCIINHHKSV